MDIEFSIINYQSGLYPKILSLRDRILRQPIGLSLFDEDLSDERNQYLIAGTDLGEPVACLMLKILDKDTVKFRQMAVDLTYQGRGVGAMILRYAENFCLLNEYTRIELHARCSAEDFYRKAGYRSEGDVFTEVGIPHVRMTKVLMS